MLNHFCKLPDVSNSSRTIKAKRCSETTDVSLPQKKKNCKKFFNNYLKHPEDFLMTFGLGVGTWGQLEAPR